MSVWPWCVGGCRCLQRGCLASSREFRSESTCLIFTQDHRHEETLRHASPREPPSSLEVQGIGSSGLSVQKALPTQTEPSQQTSLLPWAPSQLNNVPTSTDYPIKDADNFQGEKQDQANVINDLRPLEQPGYRHERENEEL